jgi:hypothetical protein
MDPQQPPAAAANVPGEVEGERFFLLPRGAFAGFNRQYLDTPDFVVNHSLSASQRRPAYFIPPLPAFIPADWFSADSVGTSRPGKAHRLAVRSAGNINGFAEHAHGRLPVKLDLFEYVFE